MQAFLTLSPIPPPIRAPHQPMEMTMAQQAILTFTDSDDGEVNVTLTFDPPVQGDAQMTGAIQLAMTALTAVREAGEDD